MKNKTVLVQSFLVGLKSTAFLSVFRGALVFGSLLLAACSGGGSGGGSSDRDFDASADPSSPTFVYDGDAPASEEIQNFKINFYDNLVADDRCGACHTPGGTGTVYFVNRDDVNLAWQEAQKVVDLADPGLSAVVQRVGDGHNCWINGGDATCAVTVQSYIERWAEGSSQDTNTINLQPRKFYEPTATRRLPANFVDVALLPPGGFDLSGSNELLGLLREYCSDCHSDDSDQAQTPFFASNDNDIAYEGLKGKVNLTNPAGSRIVVRVSEERHNCGGDCDTIATELEDAINRFALLVPVDSIDLSNTQISSAQGLLRDGIVASAGGRYETDIIAKWEFREGQGNTIADTSGIAPSVVLSVLGDHEWMSGWGMRFDGGRAQGAVDASQKLSSRISGTGEYTIEAWVAPFNVSQEDAWIMAYSGSNTNRNLMLSQTLYNYDVATRSSATGDNGGGNPVISTDDDAEFAQASLQHVVTTFDPLNGRKIYVNGIDTETVDESGGGLINNWNEGFAVTLANSVSGNRSWQGAIRMVAVHNRKLSEEQIVGNYDIGVGQKYFMLFSIAQHLNDPGNCHEGTGDERIDYCYIVFEVSEFDDASYLFTSPAFINLNSEPSPLNFDIQGLRLGINGQLALTGQGFSNISVTVDSSLFTDIGFREEGQLLVEQGTIIAKEFGAIGPDPDEFFLAFDSINNRNSVVDDGENKSLDYNFFASGEDNKPDLILRTFDAINQSFSSVTGVSSASTVLSDVTGKSVLQTYTGLKEQLPSVDDFQAYMSSHQMAITQLAAAYCDALVQDVTLRATLFPSFDFTANVSTHPQMSDETTVGENYWGENVVDPLIDKTMNTNLLSAAARTGIRDQIVTLITDTNDNHPYSFNGSDYVPDPDPALHSKKDGLRYCDNNAVCPDSRTADVVKGACTAILASGALLIN